MQLLCFINMIYLHCSMVYVHVSVDLHVLQFQYEKKYIKKKNVMHSKRFMRSISKNRNTSALILIRFKLIMCYLFSKIPRRKIAINSGGGKR